MVNNLRVLCVQLGLEWDFDDEFPPCTEGGHEHLPVTDGHVLDLTEQLAVIPR